MTILYVVLSPFLLIVGAAIMFFTARWQRKLRERGVRSGGALLGMYLIGGVWRSEEHTSELQSLSC